MATLGGRGAVLVAALCAGCAGRAGATAAEPAQPAPPVPSGTASIRKPTLLVQTLYAPELTLRVRLDGAPAEGPGKIVAVPPGDERAFDDQDEAPEMLSGTIEVEAKGGDIVLRGPEIEAASRHEAFVLSLGGHTYALPRAALREPLWCAQSIGALRGIDPCQTPLPEGDPPGACDMAGASAWLSARAGRAEKRDGCWASLDPATIARVGLVTDMALRQSACDRLLSLAGADASGEAGLSLFEVCERQMPPSLRASLLPERRRRDLPAAFEKARAQASSEQMRAFVHDYELTGDERVEQIRALALERFGPKDPARFRAIAAAVAALVSNDGRHARLCDIAGDQAEVVVRWTGEHVSRLDPPGAEGDIVPLASADEAGEVGEADESGEVGEADLADETDEAGGAGGEGRGRPSRAACKMDWRPRPPRPRKPDTFTPRLIALVKARAHVRTVRMSARCSVDHWYLEPPARPKK